MIRHFTSSSFSPSARRVPHATAALVAALTACTDAPQPTGPARPSHPGLIQIASGPVVTNTADNGDGTCDDAGVNDGCTLREAIAFAAAGGTITFAAGVTGTITLIQGQLSIGKSLTISGPGAASLAVSGNNSSRVFHVTAGTVGLAGLTITGGREDRDGGGGIANEGGILTVTRCTVAGNSAEYGGGIYSDVFDGGSLTVVQSTISGNRATEGGGIQSISQGDDLTIVGTTILNSTVSGNTVSSGNGGGVHNVNGLTRILHSTITANRAASGGGLWTFADNYTLTEVQGSIIAGNTADGTAPNDVANFVIPPRIRFRSLGYNVIGQAGANVDFSQEFNQTGDQTGVTDPAVLKLGALADNGGPTKTHAVLAGSIAVDNGDPTFNPSAFTPPLTTDQRGTGFARVVGGRVDVGAFERQVAVFPFSGFFQPVDNSPAVNSVKAGSAIPVKFAIGGDQGLKILAAGSPTSEPIACDASDPVDAIEQTTTASTSGLAYDAATGQYTYVWKTDKGWAGTCRVLTLTLTDGTTHTAEFKFTK